MQLFGSLNKSFSRGDAFRKVYQMSQNFRGHLSEWAKPSHFKMDWQSDDSESSGISEETAYQYFPNVINRIRAQVRYLLIFQLP